MAIYNCSLVIVVIAAHENGYKTNNDIKEEADL